MLWTIGCPPVGPLEKQASFHSRVRLNDTKQRLPHNSTPAASHSRTTAPVRTSNPPPVPLLTRPQTNPQWPSRTSCVFCDPLSRPASLAASKQPSRGRDIDVAGVSDCVPLPQPALTYAEAERESESLQKDKRDSSWSHSVGFQARESHTRTLPRHDRTPCSRSRPPAPAPPTHQTQQI